MSQVNELLNNMTEEELALYTANPETESHIVVNSDRNIVIPSELKKIAVQYDHDVETVTFDCPRYWDGLDMSAMIVYINYKRADGYLGSYIADNVRVSEADENIMNFEWTLSRNATLAKGNLSFLVCVKKTGENGEEVNHWNSELNREMVISEGLECTPDIVEAYPDIITQLLIRMDNVENNSGGGTGSEDGFSPIATVTQTPNGADIVITDVNGTTRASVLNGYTPQRGVDYWTPKDIAEIKGYVDEAILGGAW